MHSTLSQKPSQNREGGQAICTVARVLLIAMLMVVVGALLCFIVYADVSSYPAAAHPIPVTAAAVVAPEADCPPPNSLQTAIGENAPTFQSTKSAAKNLERKTELLKAQIRTEYF